MARATVADIARYYREWYAPNNATLVVAGDVQHATVFAKAERFFGSVPSKTLPPKPNVNPIPATGQTVEAQTRTYRDAASNTEVRVHHARLTGLTPDTDYIYAVLHDGTIPELGTQQAVLPPVTVLTSNRTRDLHDALKRRCLYH